MIPIPFPDWMKIPDPFSRPRRPVRSIPEELLRRPAPVAKRDTARVELPRAPKPERIAIPKPPKPVVAPPQIEFPAPELEPEIALPAPKIDVKIPKKSGFEGPIHPLHRPMYPGADQLFSGNFPNLSRRRSRAATPLRAPLADVPPPVVADRPPAVAQPAPPRVAQPPRIAQPSTPTWPNLFEPLTPNNGAVVQRLSLAQEQRDEECECEEPEKPKPRPSQIVATIKTFARRMSQNSLDNLKRG